MYIHEDQRSPILDKYDKKENYRICHSEKSKVLVDGVGVVAGVHDDLGDVHPHLVDRVEIDQHPCQKNHEGVDDW